MPFHPATLLVAWLGLALTLPHLETMGLVAVNLVLLPALTRPTSRTRAWRLVRRTRVLVAGLFLIYGFATPGTPLVAEWAAFSPSLEGVAQGVRQAWRLLLLLVSLAWVLSALGPGGTLAAIYTLLRPLRGLGFPLERFAVRLALVLELAESAPRTRLSPAGLAAAMAAPAVARPACVTVDLPPASWRDLLLLTWVALALGWLLW